MKTRLPIFLAIMVVAAASATVLGLGAVGSDPSEVKIMASSHETPTPNSNLDPDQISQIPLPDILARLRDEGHPPPEEGFSSWEDWFHATLTRGPLTLQQLVAKLEANSPVPPSFFGHATWEDEIAANLQKINEAQSRVAGSGGATPPPGATPPNTYPQDWDWEASGSPPVGGIAEVPDIEEPSDNDPP